MRDTYSVFELCRLPYCPFTDDFVLYSVVQISRPLVPCEACKMLRFHVTPSAWYCVDWGEAGTKHFEGNLLLINLHKSVLCISVANVSDCRFGRLFPNKLTVTSSDDISRRCADLHLRGWLADWRPCLECPPLSLSQSVCLFFGSNRERKREGRIADIDQMSSSSEPNSQCLLRIPCCLISNIMLR